MGLADFVQENPTPPRGTPCWLCHIPEAAEINAAKRDKTATVPQMRSWLLNEKGYADDEARPSRFTNHFQQSHHLRWPDGKTAA